MEVKEKKIPIDFEVNRSKWYVPPAGPMLTVSFPVQTDMDRNRSYNNKNTVEHFLLAKTLFFR